MTDHNSSPPRKSLRGGEERTIGVDSSIGDHRIFKRTGSIECASSIVRPLVGQSVPIDAQDDHQLFSMRLAFGVPENRRLPDHESKR
mmetsp:Transcript_526/g.705  ORF Transcript_526/g.705 Transcript_526/m.705 type:complete len:87 (-) Transcript_526:1-261(-)